MAEIPADWIEKAARAISRTCWMGCEEHGYVESCDPSLCMCRHGASAALAAVWPDVERREAKLKAMLDDLRMHALAGNGLMFISATEWEQAWQRVVADFPEFGDTP